MIQAKKPNEAKFLTKKRILLGILFIIISLIIVSLTIIFILDIDFNKFFEQIAIGVTNNPLAWLWLSLLIIFLFYRIYYYSIPFIVRFSRMGIHCKWYEWILFSLLCMFIAGITPTSAGAEPYMLWFCKSKGLKISESTSLIFSNGFIVQFVSCLLALPCFIYFCIIIPTVASSSSTGWLTIIIVFVGMFLMVVVNIFYGLLCLSKKAHYYLSRIWNNVKKGLKLPYHTKSQTKKTYLVDQTLKREFLEYIKQYKDTLLVTFSVVAMYVMLYCCLYFAADLCAPSVKLENGNVYGLYGEIDFLSFFWCVDLAVSVNGYIPLPGGEGTIQLVLNDLLSATGNFTNVNNEIFEQINVSGFIGNAILLWRCMTFYFPVLLSSLGIIWIGIRIIIHRINKKPISKSSKL